MYERGRRIMTKECWWGTKETEEHIRQCITSCHNPKVRAIVTDESCIGCEYKALIKSEVENED